MNEPKTLYLIFIAAVSLITFALYGADKRKSVRGAWRIRERTLLLFGVFGGAIGGILGMKIFHHKTRHWYFWAVNILALAAQVGAGAALIYLSMV